MCIRDSRYTGWCPDGRPDHVAARVPEGLFRGERDGLVPDVELCRDVCRLTLLK